MTTPERTDYRKWSACDLCPNVGACEVGEVPCLYPDDEKPTENVEEAEFRTGFYPGSD